MCNISENVYFVQLFPLIYTVPSDFEKELFQDYLTIEAFHNRLYKQKNRCNCIVMYQYMMFMTGNLRFSCKMV